MNYFETIQKWLELKKTVEHLQEQERVLREGLFNGTFPNPEEGTNTFEFSDGSKLKGVYKINRNVDEDQFAVATLSPAALAAFKVKHELSVSTYRKLSDEDRLTVDSVLKIKPGLPGLEFIPAPEPV